MTITRTRSGRDVDLANPHISDICFDDIAHHLALINRYAGATEFPISVAQHSLYVLRILTARNATPLQRLLGLLHDAHEAYLGDITRPVQQALWSREIEHTWALEHTAAPNHVRFVRSDIDDIIFQAIGVKANSTEDWLVVHAADEIALATEWRFAMKGPCPVQSEPAKFAIREVHWLKSKAAFIKAFDDLSIENGLPARDNLLAAAEGFR